MKYVCLCQYIGEGNGNPLQCSCLENPRDGGAWWAAVYGVTQSRTRLKRLSSSSSSMSIYRLKVYITVGHYLIMMYPILLVIHLFLLALGLPCCVWAFSSCNKQELLLCGRWALGSRASVAVHTGLVAAACKLWSEGSVVVAHGLRCPGVWGLLRSGIKPTSPALAGRFLTTG